MSCRLCDSAEEHREFEVSEMMFGLKDRFAYFQCSNCECIQAAEIIDDLTRYYPQDYFSLMSNHPGEMESWPVPDWCATMTGGPIVKYLEILRDPTKDWDRILTERVVDYYLSGVNPARDWRILDVGTANGEFLRSLRRVGFTGQLTGIEPYIERDIEFEDGVQIKKGTIFDLDLEQEWDLITFHHSFEHVPNPLEVLRAASRLLSKEGVCLIRTPIVPCHAWEHYGVNWISLDAPRHYFIPSAKSMRILAERSNLFLKDVIYDSTAFQFWASEQYVRDIPFYSERSFTLNPMNSTIPLAQLPIFEMRAEALNREGRGDQAAFYLTHAQQG
jgi:SAM-dependent methyltransferase